jgi:hypothetical protein
MPEQPERPRSDQRAGQAARAQETEVLYAAVAAAYSRRGRGGRDACPGCTPKALMGHNHRRAGRLGIAAKPKPAAFRIRWAVGSTRGLYRSPLRGG